jgi:TonB family protein
MTYLVNGWSDLFVLWSWQALLILAFTWTAVRLSRCGMPSVRHRLWLFGMIAVAALPILMLLAKFLPAVSPGIEPLVPVANFPVAMRIATDPVSSFTNVSYASIPAPRTGSRSVFRTILPIAWLAGFGWSFAVFCISWWKMHRIRKRSREVRSSAPSAVPVGLATEISSPVLAGLFRPMILLPVKVSEGTTREERHAIILHEEAHLRRRDHYLVVIQRLMEAVFFFHPMVRYASRQLSLERELACDEEVLRAGVQPADYADAILKVAELDLQRRGAVQPAFNESRKILERRIDMIFKGHHRLLPSVSGRLATVVSAFALVAVMGCLLVPQRSLAEGISAAAELEMIQNALSKYVPKVVSVPPQAVQSPILPAAAVALAPVPVALAQVPPAGQSQPSSISGKVLDPSGALIPGVIVKIKGTHSELATTTDVTGTFAFPQAPADTYRLEASLPGFATKVFTFTMSPGGAWRENLILNLAAVNTYVQISASRPSVVPGVAPPPITGAPGIPAPPQRIGGDVAQAQLLTQTKPIYPPTARAAGIQGDVLIQATIGRDGSVMNPTVINRGVDPELAQAALQAVTQWRYKPALLNGQPVEILTEISVSFSLVD